MVKWLMALPRRLFVIVILTAGILFIVFSDPPRTICDAQLEAFQERTNFFLEIEEKKKSFKKKSLYQESLEQCGFGRTSGSCYDLFQGMRTMLREARSVVPECYPDLASESKFRQAIWETLDLMVKLSWGDAPPLTSAMRLGIFDQSDLAFFCELKNISILLYSDSKWVGFVEDQLKAAKGGETMSREEKWSRSIMSANCGS